MTAGIKTTEFWLSLAALVAPFLREQLSGASPWQTVLTAVIGGLTAIGYTASRTVLKTAMAKSGA